MAFAFQPDFAFQGFTGLLLVALGIFSGWKGSNAASRALAVYASLFGAIFVLSNLSYQATNATLATVLEYAAVVVAVPVPFAVLALGVALARGFHRRAASEVAVIASMGLVGLVIWLVRVAPNERVMAFSTIPVALDHILFGWFVVWGLLQACVLWYWFRTDPAMPGLGLLSIGLAAYMLFNVGHLILGLAQALALGGSRNFELVAAWVFPYLLLAVAWFRRGLRGDSGAAGTAAAFAALLLLGMVSAGLGPPGDVLVAVARTVAVAALAFAVLRHQVFGLDVRVKWTIKQSTLAAFFVVAFFTASEAAQTFFGDRFNDDYAGIAAAGLLLFALAPLQRVAEAVSNRVLPDVRSVVRMDRAEQEYVYEEALRAAWADGKLSRDEQALLRRLAASLKLSPEDVARLDDWVAGNP